MCHVRRSFIFFSHDSKQNSATTAIHSKRIIELSQNRTLLFAYMSNIWENTDGYAEQYRFATALYLFSMLAHAYNIIIYRGVRAPGHGRKVVDGLNATKKRFLSMLMTTVQMPGAEVYNSQTEIHTSTAKTDISLASEFQKHLSDPTRAHVLLDQGKEIKHAIKRKLTEREYHLQGSQDVSHISVKILCETTQLP